MRGSQAVALLLALTSCSEAANDASETTGAPGASTGTTAASSGSATVTGTTAQDTGSTGASGSSTDASSGTTGSVGLGELSGDCGEIDADELTTPQPFAFRNAIDLGSAGFDESVLTEGARNVLQEGNLNPSSLYSEAIAFEVLARCDMAELLKTEAEVEYTDPMGKKTDLLVELDGLRIGVSVTRAYGYPPEAPYTQEQAETLLTGKLSDILVSSANVAATDVWEKQILHVIAYEDMHADSIEAAWATLDGEVKADTILLVSVTHGEDMFIYE